MKDTLFFKLYSHDHNTADSSLFGDYPNIEKHQQYVSPKVSKSVFTEHLLHKQNELYQKRNTQNNDYFFPFLIGNLIVLITVLTLYRKQFSHTFFALFSAKYYQQIELKTIIKHPITIIFFFVYIINLGLLIELITDDKNLNFTILNHSGPIDFITITLALTSYYLVKIISILASAHIFKAVNYGRIYIDYLLIWMMNIALLTGLFLWFFVYQNNALLLPMLASVWLLLSIFRISQTLLRIIPKSDFNLFHFFVYLCAVEILPLIVLGKLVILEF